MVYNKINSVSYKALSHFIIYCDTHLSHWIVLAQISVRYKLY